MHQPDLLYNWHLLLFSHTHEHTPHARHSETAYNLLQEARVHAAGCMRFVFATRVRGQKNSCSHSLPLVLTHSHTGAACFPTPPFMNGPAPAPQAPTLLASPPVGHVEPAALAVMGAPRAAALRPQSGGSAYLLLDGTKMEHTMSDCTAVRHMRMRMHSMSLAQRELNSCTSERGATSAGMARPRRVSLATGTHGRAHGRPHGHAMPVRLEFHGQRQPGVARSPHSRLRKARVGREAPLKRSFPGCFPLGSAVTSLSRSRSASLDAYRP